MSEIKKGDVLINIRTGKSYQVYKIGLAGDGVTAIWFAGRKTSIRFPLDGSGVWEKLEPTESR